MLEKELFRNPLSSETKAETNCLNKYKTFLEIILELEKLLPLGCDKR